MIEPSESAPPAGWRKSLQRDWERIKGWLGIEPGRLGRRFLILAALLWAVEWFIIQEWTFRSAYPRILADELRLSLPFRLGRNLLFSLAILFGLPRIASLLAFGIWGVFATSAVAFHVFFERALSLQTLKTALLEGVAVAGAGLSLVQWELLVVLCVLLGLKAAFVWRDRSRLRMRWRLAAIFLMAWAALGLWANKNFLPLQMLVKHVPFERMAAAYGYLWTWVGEQIYLEGQVLERALEEAKNNRSNRLSGEAALPVADKVAIIQMESVEFESLGFELGGELVMPFLSSLRETSRFYKVRAIHENGSADADFSMLTGLAPSPDVITYRIRGYPYEDPLPSLFRRAGYRTEFFHGLYGDFFNRRPIMEKRMGFDSVVFEEELVERHGATPTRWGVKDRNVFQLAAQEMNTTEGPVFQFIITLTSHNPFDYLEEHEREISPRLPPPKDEHERRLYRYADSIRYLDRALEAYYEALPEGSLLILYGDHSSFALPRSARDSDGKLIEFVPYLIHQKGSHLASADPTLAQRGVLTQLDMVTHIRNYALELVSVRTTASSPGGKASAAGLLEMDWDLRGGTTRCGD